MRWIRHTENRFLLKLLLGFTGIAVISTCLIGLMMWTQANKAVIGEISKDNIGRLEQIKDYLELSVLGKFEGTSLIKVISTVNPESHNDMQFFLDRDPDMHMYRLVQLVGDMRSITMANEGMVNMTVYYRQNDFVIDQRFYYESPDSHPETAFLRSLEQAPINHWFVRAIHTNTQEEAAVLTYVSPLPYMSTGDRIKGYIYIDVSLDYLQLTAARMLNSAEENLRITAGEQIVVQSGNLETASDYRLDKAATKILPSGNAVSHLSADRSKYGWSYALERPLDSFLVSSNQLKVNLWLICLAVIGIGLLISLLFSYRFHLPLKQVTGALRSQTSRMHKLQDQLQTKIWLSLLAGNAPETSSLPWNDMRASYVVCAIRVWVGQVARIEADIRAALEQQQLSCPLIQLQNDELTLIVKLESTQTIDAVVSCLRMRIDAYPADTVTLAVGLGAACPSPEHLHLAGKQAREALKYAFLLGLNRPLCYTDTQSRTKLVNYECYELWQRMLLSGDEQALCDYLDQFADELIREPYRIDAVEIAVLQFIAILSHCMVEISRSALPADFLDSMRKDTLIETIATLKARVRQFLQEQQQRHHHAHALSIEQIKQYIDEHLHEDLSLNKLAEIVHLSPSYVSTLFRDMTSMTFTEYLGHSRMERAAGLLFSSSMTVSQIAQQTGYPNVQYFCTKFKNTYGLTPASYRKSERQRVELSTL